MRKKDIGKLHKSKGITLIEILLVVVIIAIVAIISIPLLTQSIYSGYDGRRKSDLNKIAKSLEEYYTDFDCYPSSLPACNPGDGLKPYLSKIPCDPRSGEDYVYYADPELTCPTWFWVFGNLERPDDAQSEKQGCQFGCGPTASTTFYEYYDQSTNAPDPFMAESGQTDPPGCTSGFYGCKNRRCTPICVYGGTPECSPNYSRDDCYGSCSNPANECM